MGTIIPQHCCCDSNHLVHNKTKVSKNKYYQRVIKHQNHPNLNSITWIILKFIVELWFCS